jgi:peptidoglycan glycosyltransferase
MTRNIQRLAQSIFLGFALIAVSLLYWQVVRAPELAARDDNPRLVQTELRTRRGRLLDRYGAVLAYSDLMPGLAGTRDEVQRRYPQPEADHVVGYYSLRYGTGGAEAAFDATLRGQLTPLDRLLHRPQTGHDVVLSLDLSAQRAADQALAKYQGAVVLLDITDGGLLALVSHPAYDPNTLDEDWNALAADPDAPLLNRATQGVYPVGDLARLVGLAGLLSAGITTPPDPLATPLGDMLAPLSPGGYLATARQLGFDVPPHFDLPTGPGLLPDFSDGRSTPRDLAVTPLHMARLAAAIAGDGRMPLPTLAYSAPAVSPNRAFAPNVAVSLQAVTPRFDEVAGWAGVATPQETGDQPLSWFVGYAPADSPRFAIAIVVEDSDGGALVTLPIAQQTASAIQ